jgi:hypothetical protein
LHLQTADAKLWTGAFHRQSAKQSYHSRLHADVSIFQQNGVDILLSHGMIARERFLFVFLLHNGSRDIAALSERAAPSMILSSGRWRPTPSYFVAMVLVFLSSSGVSGMTNMLQTS